MGTIAYVEYVTLRSSILNAPKRKGLALAGQALIAYFFFAFGFGRFFGGGRFPCGLRFVP